MAQPHLLSLEEDVGEKLTLILHKDVSQMRSAEEESSECPVFQCNSQDPSLLCHENGGKNLK